MSKTACSKLKKPICIEDPSCFWDVGKGCKKNPITNSPHVLPKSPKRIEFQKEKSPNPSTRALPKLCVPSELKKYTTRKSPPYPANECKGLTLLGNDGEFYISKETSTGVSRWSKVTTHNQIDKSIATRKQHLKRVEKSTNSSPFVTPFSHVDESVQKRVQVKSRKPVK